jgi:hypothetical protein
MMLRKLVMAAMLVPLVSACEGDGTDKTSDYGIDRKSLTELKAGIWIDPNGCDHWIVDDGLEGYLSARLTPDGKPVCSGKAPGGYAYGPYRDGSIFNRN